MISQGVVGPGSLIRIKCPPDFTTPMEVLIKDITILRKNIQGWNQEMYLKMRESQYYSHPMWFKGGKP
jgi:hypothetical protein